MKIHKNHNNDCVYQGTEGGIYICVLKRDSCNKRVDCTQYRKKIKETQVKLK